jgi:hypothetical protein
MGAPTRHLDARHHTSLQLDAWFYTGNLRRPWSEDRTLRTGSVGVRGSSPLGSTPFLQVNALIVELDDQGVDHLSAWRPSDVPP